MRKLVLLGLSGALFFGCGDDDARPDGGTFDSGGVDSTTPDTGGVDAPTGDTGMADTSVADTGGGGMCPPGACDLLTNVGCAAGEACYFVTTMDGVPPSPMCLAAGTGTDGATCPDPTDCQEGFVCILEDGETMPGTCRQACCGTTDPCAPGATCNTFEGTDNYGFCLLPDGCDIILQTGCEASEDCVVVAMDGGGSCRPGNPGGGGQGADCSDGSAGCMGGFLCLAPAGGTDMCSQACNPTAGDPGCPEGTTCGNVGGFPETLGGCVPSM